MQGRTKTCPDVSKLQVASCTAGRHAKESNSTGCGEPRAEADIAEEDRLQSPLTYPRFDTSAIASSIIALPRW
jgi:hypothetical protein